MDLRHTAFDMSVEHVSQGAEALAPALDWRRHGSSDDNGCGLVGVAVRQAVCQGRASGSRANAVHSQQTPGKRRRPQHAFLARIPAASSLHRPTGQRRLGEGVGRPVSTRHWLTDCSLKSLLICVSTSAVAPTAIACWRGFLGRIAAPAVPAVLSSRGSSHVAQRLRPAASGARVQIDSAAARARLDRCQGCAVDWSAPAAAHLLLQHTTPVWAGQHGHACSCACHLSPLPVRSCPKPQTRGLLALSLFWHVRLAFGISRLLSTLDFRLFDPPSLALIHRRYSRLLFQHCSCSYSSLYSLL